MTVKRSMFHSYTLREAEQTAKVWAGLALSAFGGLLFFAGKYLRATGDDWAYYTSNSEAAFLGGVLAGVGAIATFAGLWIEVGGLTAAAKARKAYKKANPEMFDTAGDERETPA